mmetsp:Transcript_45320/g.97166  ORF Transcript_45320/g.97166 Transcript_45320/m.97166 type:complete len:90 (-) Transcript_45320:52-321(-)
MKTRKNDPEGEEMEKEEKKKRSIAGGGFRQTQQAQRGHQHHTLSSQDGRSACVTPPFQCLETGQEGGREIDRSRKFAVETVATTSTKAP